MTTFVSPFTVDLAAEGAALHLVGTVDRLHGSGAEKNYGR